MPDVSVIVAVRDHEDVVGHEVRDLGEHLATLGLDFEILAVNDGSVDNSFPVLGLLARHMPELAILRGDSRGRPFARGIAEARAASVLLIEAGGRVSQSLDRLAWAMSRLATGSDAVVFRGACIVARRLRVRPIVARVSGSGPAFERAFERRATDLRVDIVGRRPARQPAVHRLLGPVLRLLAA